MERSNSRKKGRKRDVEGGGIFLSEKRRGFSSGRGKEVFKLIGKRIGQRTHSLEGGGEKGASHEK